MTDLSVADYDRAESRALETTANRIVECCLPVTFAEVGYPTRIGTTAGAGRYVDVMQERRAEGTFDTYLVGLTADEMALLGAVAEKVAAMTERLYGRRMVPRCSMLRALVVVRHLRHLLPDRTATILEIGPGSGYVGALLLELGYGYVATDVTQAFYLYQNHLFNAVTGGRVVELATDPRGFFDMAALPAGTAVHVPWWKFVLPEPSIAIAVNAVTCNHALCEMHPAALTYSTKVGASLLAGPGFRPFVIEGWGSTINTPLWHAGRALAGAGLVFVHNDMLATVLVPRDAPSAVAAGSLSLPLPGVDDPATAFHPPVFADADSSITRSILTERARIHAHGVHSLADFDARLRAILGREDLSTDDERFMVFAQDPRL